MPMMPNRLKGPRDLRLFIKHSGSKANVVIPNKACVLVMTIPKKELAKDGRVKLRIMEYAKTLQDVTRKQAAAGIHAVFGETARSQAWRYDLAPV